MNAAPDAALCSSLVSFFVNISLITKDIFPLQRKRRSSPDDPSARVERQEYMTAGNTDKRPLIKFPHHMYG